MIPYESFFLPLVILVLLFVACSAAVPASEINKVAEKINCVCGGCDLVVSDCDCDRAEELTAVIEKRLARGQAEEQIIQDLVRQYGQRVLT